jgi:outer membrane protein assembly factor BamB
VNGLVYVGSGDGYLYALDAARGGLEWKYNAGRSIESSPCVSSGVVYVCADNSNVTAINALTGAEIWTAQVQPPIEDGLQTSPVTENGLLFISNSYFGLAAFNASSGSVVWSTQGYSFVGSPSVANGTVYVGNVAFNISTGRQLWSFNTGNQINASPAVFDGVVYIGSQDGNFYAIGTLFGISNPSPASLQLTQAIFILSSILAIIVAVGIISIIVKNRQKKKI